MAVTYAAAATGAASASTSLTISNPGFTSGQYIVALISGINTPSSIVAPSGFGNPNGAVSTGSNGSYVSMFGKWAGSEPSSYAWAWTPSNYVRITMIGLTGFSVSSGTPISTIAARGSTSSGSTVTYPSVRVDIDDGYVLLAAGLYDNRAYNTVTNYDAIQNVLGRLHVWGRSDPPLTATGNLTETLTDGSTHYASLALHLSPTAVPAPSWVINPTVTGTVAKNGVLTCATGTALYAVSYAVQWQRNTGSGWVNISGATNTTYTLTATDSKATVRPLVTATGVGGTAQKAGLGVSFYEQVSADIGHALTATVTGRNTAGTDTATSAGITTQFQNLTPPGITGGEVSMDSGVTLTASAGTYQETVTSRSYQWMADYTDIPGATNSTFTPGPEYGGWRIRVRENVSGPLGTGQSTSTAFRYFPTMAVPFLQDASPWFEEIPADAPVDDSMTSTWQGWLTGQQNTTAVWWTNGGPNGQGYSAFLNIVDSSMPRVPWNLSPISGQPTNYTTPVKNGGDQAHLAWSWGVKNGGVPMHPCGVKIDRAGDHTIHIYCRDTYELWSGWVARQAGDIGNTYPQINWGSYIPDVRQYIGYCQDLHGGSEGYAPGTVDEYQYKSWGDAAIYPSLPGMIQQRYLQAGEIPHMIGLLMPGNNQGSPRYPGLRSEVNGFYTPMPPGGIIRVDPTLDPDTLPSLGSQARNDIRKMFVTCLQKHGMTILDTALSVIAAFRIEDLVFYQDSWTYQGTSLNSIMRSIPVSAYQYLSTSYRPTGTPVPPPNRAVSSFHMSTDDMNPYSGCTLDQTGRLTLSATFGALAYAKAFADLTSDEMYWKVTQGASILYCQVKTGSQNTTNGAWFKIDTQAGTLRAECRYNNTTVGTDTSASYSPTNHAWMKIGESGGTLTWSTAADVNGEPGSWSTFRTQVIPGSFWDITAATIAFYCPPNGAGSAIVTNLNNVPAPVATSAGWVLGVS